MKLSYDRLKMLKVNLALAFISSILCSITLFIDNRSYPLIKVLSFWPTLPTPIDYFLMIGFLVLLLIFSLLPLHHFLEGPLVMGALGMAILLIMGDQNRLLPWYYQYFLMIFPFLYYLLKQKIRPVNVEDQQTYEKQILNLNRLVIICFYWSAGFHKFNYKYMVEVFPWVIDPMRKFLLLYLHVSLSETFLHVVAVASAIFEFSLGFGLLFSKTRKGTLLALSGFHLMIFGMLGPWGHNYARSVWPWNLAMILLSFTLFWQTSNVSPQEILGGRSKDIFHRFYLALLISVPLLAWHGYCDSYLGFSIFSGHTRSAIFLLEEKVKEQLDPQLHRYVSLYDKKYYFFNNSEWAMKEHQASAIPEERNFLLVQRYLCQKSQFREQVIMIVRDQPDWLTGKIEERTEKCPDNYARPEHSQL